jgi:DNA-directed RNA polymerase beta' subunit
MKLTYHHFSLKYGTCFEAGIGAEAIYRNFQKHGPLKAQRRPIVMLEKAGALKRKTREERLSLIRSMHIANIRPEWMFMTVFLLFHQHFVLWLRLKEDVMQHLM